MRSRHSKLLPFTLAFATLLMWLEGAPLVPGPGANHPTAIPIRSTLHHLSLEVPHLRSLPPGPGKAFRIFGEAESFDLEEEDGQMAVLVNLGLALLPVLPPALPSPHLSVAPERGNSLFLTLGRIRC